jgi:hypothetical protein
LAPCAKLIKSSEPWEADVTEYLLYVRRYAPFESFGGGFEGDNRGYSTNPAATARTSAVVSFLPTSDARLTAASSSGTSWVGPWAVRKSHKLGAIGHHIGQVRASVTSTVTNYGQVSFTLHTQGNLPLKDVLLRKSVAGVIDNIYAAFRPNSPHPQGSPDIETFIDFVATFASAAVVFEGAVRGDGFPNAELFVTDGNGRAAGLVDYRTKSGIMGPYHRLERSHPNYRLASFRRSVTLNKDGSFGPDASAPPPVTHEP